MLGLRNTSDDIASDARRLVRAVAADVTGHRSVALWGSKGGVGTTTVAVLLGLALARHRPEGTVAVADRSLYGTASLRMGLVLQAEPLHRPATPGSPGLYVGAPAPSELSWSVHDTPEAGSRHGAEIVVAATSLDAIMCADGHGAPLAVLTSVTPRPAIRVDAAIRRLGGTEAVIHMPHDPHLAIGGPIWWDRLLPETRDATRRLVAAVVAHASRSVSRPERTSPDA